MTSHVLDLFRNALGLAVYVYDLAAFKVRDRLGLFNGDEVNEIVEDETADLYERMRLVAQSRDSEVEDLANGLIEQHGRTTALERENNTLRRTLNEAHGDLAITKIRLSQAQAQFATRSEAF